MQATLRAWLAQQLPWWACVPQHFMLLPSLPRTPAGKVLRPVLAAMAEQQLGQQRQQQLEQQQQLDQQQLLEQQQQQQPPDSRLLPPPAYSEPAIMSVFTSLLGHGLEPCDDFFAAGKCYRGGNGEGDR